MTRAQSRMTAALDSPARVRVPGTTRPARRDPASDLAGVFECSPVPMAVVSSEGLVQRVNVAMERLLSDAGAEAAFAADPMRAPTLDQIVRVPAAEAASVADVLGGRRRAASFDADLGAGDAARAARVTISSLRPGAASPVALVTVEDRRAETRAAELEAQLRHVARLSLAGELCGSLAHEMGQPLAAVANYTQAAILQLTRSGSAGEALAHLRAADAAAQRAGRILRNLAGFVRAGRCDRKPENLCDVVADAGEMINAAAASAGLRADVQVLDESLPVHIDRVQIQQVLLNLVRNAAEATRAATAAAGGESRGGGEHGGGGPVLVRVWSPEEGLAEVAVRDSGPGLPAAVQQRLFTPFFTTKPRGMGLGLAICRSIIEAHGGGLWGENNPPPARGATFRFRLPIHTVTNPGDKSYDG